MKLKSKLKNTVLAGLAGLSLTACGGGGSGGAVGVVDDFVQDLSNLSGSATLVSSYSSLLSDFQSVVSGGDMSAIQGVITGPDAGDISQANTLLTQLETAKNLWEATEYLIDQQNDSDKFHIYNSDSFKQAHAAMLYLQNHVKPVIQKVANGQTITLADYNLVDKESKANEIIEQEKNSTSSDYANTKKIKSVQTINNDTDVSTVANNTPVVTYTEWAVVEGQGQETRTRTTTTTPVTTTVTTRCTLQRTTFLNNSTSDGAESCSVLDPVITEGTAIVVEDVETRVGAAVVIDKSRNDVLDPVTSTETPVVTYTQWAVVEGQGQETRTKTTTTRNKTTVVTNTCTWQESTVNGTTTNSAENCNITDTQVTYQDDTVVEELETRVGDAVVTNKSRNDVLDPVTSTETPVVTYTNWAVVEGQGQDTRTKTTTTRNKTTVVTNNCTWQESTVNGTTTKGAETCTVADTQVTYQDDTVVEEVEIRTGAAHVVDYNRTDVLDPVTSTETPVLTYTDWVTVHAGGGQETRTRTTTTRNKTTVITQNCAWQTSTVNGATTKGAETCTATDTQVTYHDDTVATATETRTGENPVTSTTNLDPTVVTETENSANYTETTYTDASGTTSETVEGSATTNTVNRDVAVVNDNGNNTSTTVVTRYVDTIVTTPITTKVYRTRNYTDTVKRNSRTVTTTTPRQRLTYRDGTYEDTNGTTTVVNGDWSATQLSDSSRSENILQSETTVDRVVTTSSSGTEISRITASNAYSDLDTNLGSKTANLSTTVSDHQTTEFNNSTGLTMINADHAYAKGWTGEGAVLGVIDTWQDTNHADFNGKYQWYKDYVRNDNTVPLYGSQHAHGTHVAGIVAAEKNNTGTHGVAYNADLVGANVDYHGNGMINKGLAQQALHDFAKLKSPESAGGEEMNIVAVNMSFNQPNFFYDGNGSTVTQLSDGTYNATEITTRLLNNGYGDSEYWKVATDNDIILVNSAGNYGFDHAGDPGIWAVEEDNNGNLILGGKMVIVGSWDGSGVSGNKAGHVCLNINTSNNTCNDTHRLSEFYILAPGSHINSTIPTGMGNNGNDTATMSGTSMSAPHVTGAFGVLNQMWPYMNGENLVKLVMNTADKTLTGYNVNIHGQGLLDLDEATKPQGAVGLATSGRVDHPTVSLNNTYYSTGTSAPSSLLNLKIMVLDEYDRNYYMDLGSSFTVKDNRKFSDVQMLVDNKNMFLPQQQMYGSFSQGGQYSLLNNYNFGLYTGNNGAGDYSANVGKDFYFNNKFKLKTSLAHMNEQDTWLGNSSDGVLAVGNNNDTNSANLGVAYQLGNNVLSLDYSKGFTDVNTVDNSLIKSFSDIETESYRLAYEIHKDKHTTFGWSFSLPSHITSGTMDLEVAESVNIDGTINYTDIKSDLTQTTKEKNIGFYYNKSGEEELDASFNFTAEYRMDKSGVANNNGVELGLNFVKKFAGSCKFLWMKNPKCFDKDGKMKADLFGKNTDNATAHGLVYDLETDKFIPIKK